VVRTILKVKRLYDVSPVTFPAYPDTDVAKRSLDAWKASKEEEKKPEEAPKDNSGYCPDVLNKYLSINN
jgi:phage head maturation protease